MPINIATLSTKKRLVVVALSKDWYSPRPWIHKGKDISYFTKINSVSATGNVRFTYLYLGPLSIVIGKWIKEDAQD